MYLGRQLIKSWSSTQQVMALWCGEAELHGMLIAATQTEGLISTMVDFSEKVEATVCSDASAAIEIAHRQCLENTRHVVVQYLWIQREVKEGNLTVKKASTNNNPADILTKAMNGEKVIMHIADMGLGVGSSRAHTESCPHRSNALTNTKPAAGLQEWRHAVTTDSLARVER